MSKMCPTCDKAMIPGRRQDEKDNFSAAQETWLQGNPEREQMGWFKGGDKPVPVTTYACPRCGLLRSYVDTDDIPHKL